jgi:DNA-binding response OmpR family regulator
MARILVVDDDTLVRETVAAVLRDAAHDVAEAADGRQALGMLDDAAYDLVVTDVLMPEVDGIGLVLAIRKRHPSLRIVCVSGGGRNVTESYLPVAAKLGADMTLAKPFLPAELLETVDAALAMHPPPARAVRCNDR